MGVEELIAADRWEDARREIRQKLKAEPQSHWLLTRLGLTYYEQRRYKTALKYELQALRLAPTCPLVLWDYAGTLQMLGRHGEALDVYRRLVRRGVARLATGLCGEGRAWARGLVADCHYRMVESLDALGERRQADRALAEHLDARGPGCRSIYSLKEISSSLNNRRPNKRMQLTSATARPRARS